MQRATRKDSWGSGVLNTSVGGDKILDVKGSFMEHITGDLKSHTDKERQESGLEGIQNNSEKSINKHAKENIEHNSGEDTKQN